jgi:hypothetical protein
MVGAPGIEVLDLELSIGDPSGLSNQLISSLTNRIAIRPERSLASNAAGTINRSRDYLARHCATTRF